MQKLFLNKCIFFGKNAKHFSWDNAMCSCALSSLSLVAYIIGPQMQMLGLNEKISSRQCAIVINSKLSIKHEHKSFYREILNQEELNQEQCGIFQGSEIPYGEIWGKRYLCCICERYLCNKKSWYSELPCSGTLLTICWKMRNIKFYSQHMFTWIQYGEPRLREMSNLFQKSFYLGLLCYDLGLQMILRPFKQIGDDK